MTILRTTVGRASSGVLTEDRVVRMGFDMLLEILRPLESLTTELASMRLEWYMNTDVRGDVIALYDSDTTVRPCASQVKIVGAFATNVGLADVVL